jgi:hypothetical protein
MLEDDDTNNPAPSGIRKRRVDPDPVEAPAVNLQPPEPSTTTADPATPVAPVTYSDADIARPTAINPQPRRTELQADQDALETVRNTAPKKQSRAKAAILNSLFEMSQGANQVSQAAMMTGRPVDQYGVASIVGRGLGGAGRGIVDPAIMNKRKREMQMTQLATQIQRQLEVEKQQSENQYRAAEAGWYQQRGTIEQGKIKQQRVMQQLRLKKGQLFDPTKDAQLLKDAADVGVNINPDEWNNSKDNYATLTLTDPEDPTKTRAVRYNKVTGEQEDVGQRGFQQPVDSKTGMTAAQEAGLNQRQKEFAQRMNLSERGYQLRLETARENERHHLETEKSARTSQGLAVTRIKLGYTQAKARAKLMGISMPDYEAIMGDLGVDVIDDSEKK